jgi:hypothetical protein
VLSPDPLIRPTRGCVRRACSPSEPRSKLGGVNLGLTDEDGHPVLRWPRSTRAVLPSRERGTSREPRFSFTGTGHAEIRELVALEVDVLGARETLPRLSVVKPSCRLPHYLRASTPFRDDRAPPRGWFRGDRLLGLAPRRDERTVPSVDPTFPPALNRTLRVPSRRQRDRLIPRAPGAEPNREIPCWRPEIARFQGVVLSASVWITCVSSPGKDGYIQWNTSGPRRYGITSTSSGDGNGSSSKRSC